MLELVNITYAYGTKTAVASFSLCLEKQAHLAILGPSGCGKTTLLNLIAGLLSPSSGQLRFEGKDITTIAANARHFALMFQDFALFPHLTVIQNVMFGLRARGLSKRKAQESAQAILADFGLALHAKQTIWHLSGGEQQRVALARALVTQPRLLLLDEPFSKLDPILSTTLQQECLERVARAGCNMIFVTHNCDEAFSLADRIALMCDGKLVQMGTTEQVLAAPCNPWVARFIGYQNVSEQRVIPEAAIHLGDSYPSAAIKSIQFQREGVRLELHSLWGTLFVTLTAREQQQFNQSIKLGKKIGLGVNEEKIIYF